jgi:hypothetical protein
VNYKLRANPRQSKERRQLLPQRGTLADKSAPICGTCGYKDAHHPMGAMVVNGRPLAFFGIPLLGILLICR